MEALARVLNPLPLDPSRRRPSHSGVAGKEVHGKGTSLESVGFFFFYPPKVGKEIGDWGLEIRNLNVLGHTSASGTQTILDHLSARRRSSA